MNEYEKWIKNNDNPPSKLYHYTTVEGFYGICNSGGNIWATNIDYLNDSLEYKDAQIRFIETIRKKLDTTKNMNNKNRISSLILRYDENSILPLQNNQNVYVISFSTKPDDLSQWRAYCTNGGIMMEFNSKELIKTTTHPKQINEFKLIECIYSKFKKEELISEIISWYTSEPDEIPYTELLNRLAKLSCAFKDKAFTDEQEWRLICTDIHWEEKSDKSKPTLTPNSPKNIEFRIKDNMLIPHINYNLNPNIIDKKQEEKMKLFGYAFSYTHSNALNLQGSSPSHSEDDSAVIEHENSLNKTIKRRNKLHDKYTELYSMHADRTKLPLPLTLVIVGPGDYDKSLLRKSIVNFLTSKVKVLEYIASADRMGHEQYERKFDIEVK